MSYDLAMSAAGAVIHQYREFGSYQGDWFALVTYKGETGWVNGSFGSCSGCDSFLSEFGYNERDKCDKHAYDTPPSSCAACAEAAEKYNKHLAEFGRGYLDTMMTQEQIERYAAKHASWSLEDREALDWIKEHAIKA